VPHLFFLRLSAPLSAPTSADASDIWQAFGAFFVGPIFYTDAQIRTTKDQNQTIHKNGGIAMKLKMMTDQVGDMITKMGKTVTDITACMTTVKTACSSLVGVNWKSPAATEFQNLLNQLHSQSTPKIEELNKLKGRLSREKTQWEQTGSKLAG
jgi:uncharacterized protein YukE